MMKSERELIYEWLLKEFEQHAQSLGGWQTERGVYLDGKLWAISEQLTKKGVRV